MVIPGTGSHRRRKRRCLVSADPELDDRRAAPLRRREQHLPHARGLLEHVQPRRGERVQRERRHDLQLRDAGLRLPVRPAESIRLRRAHRAEHPRRADVLEQGGIRVSGSSTSGPKGLSASLSLQLRDRPGGHEPLRRLDAPDDRRHGRGGALPVRERRSRRDRVGERPQGRRAVVRAHRAPGALRRADSPRIVARRSRDSAGEVPIPHDRERQGDPRDREQAGHLYANHACTPNPDACGVRECGTANDGCGGTVSCGVCARTDRCVAGACVPRIVTCAPGLHYCPDVGCTKLLCQ